MNDLAKTKIYAGVAIMVISGVLFALKLSDAAQTMAVVGSALLIGLGLNAAGHAAGQAVGSATATVLGLAKGISDGAAASEEKSDKTGRPAK